MQSNCLERNRDSSKDLALEKTELLGPGVTVGDEVGLPGAGVGVGVGVGVGFCRLLIAYSAAPMIMPLVLSIVCVNASVLINAIRVSVTWSWKARLNIRSHVLSKEQYYASPANQLLI